MADVVTEIFADNERVDMVRDSSIDLFVELIRKAGRKPQYVDFLIVLCDCNGRSVRSNQTRVARRLLQQAPELLVQIRLVNGVVFVNGDPKYFSNLGKEVPLIDWLKSTNDDDILCVACTKSRVIAHPPPDRTRPSLLNVS